MRELSNEEIESAIGKFYYLDELVELLKQYRRRGKSVYCYFNGFKLTSDNIEQLVKEYYVYAEDLRAAISGRYFDPADFDDRLKNRNGAGHSR